MLDSIGELLPTADLSMEVDITQIKSYVLSLKDAISRRNKMAALMNSIGVVDWSFFDSIDVRGRLPYWVGCGMSHRELIAQAKFPCIVYEDDIEKTQWYRSSINIPEESIVYLGLSKWGTRSGQSEVNGVLFFESDYPEVLGVQYMLSAHAIYYPTRESAVEWTNGITRHMLEKGKPMDEWFATIQTRQEVYCLRQPLFYQDCEKNKVWTDFEVNENDIIS